MGGERTFAVLFLVFSVAAAFPVSGHRKLLSNDDEGDAYPGASATADANAAGPLAIAATDTEAEWTHTYSVSKSGSVSSGDNSNAVGNATADAVGPDAYTVTHTATAAEDEFAASVSTSFTTFDPSYQNVANYQSGDDDEGGVPLVPLPKDGAYAVAAATAYGEDPYAQTAAKTTGYYSPGASDPTYTADAYGTAVGDVANVETSTFAG